jgi:ATP-dependent RNA helicase RhlE
VSEIPPYRQTLLFSATMPPEVEALARTYLRKPVVVQIGRRSEAVSTVTHAVYPVPRERKTKLLVELLKQSNMDSVLIFTRTKHGADRVVRHLEDEGIAATAMHADKSQGERTRALEDFKSGKIRVSHSSRKTTCTASGAPAAPPPPVTRTHSCRRTR